MPSQSPKKLPNCIKCAHKFYQWKLIMISVRCTTDIYIRRMNQILTEKIFCLYLFSVWFSGLRSLKIVLKVFANRLLTQSSETEENLIYRSLLDVNMPKINPKDMPMFKSVIDDLFSNVTTEEKNYDWLRSAYEQRCTVKGYQPVELQYQKLVEIHEMSRNRQGIVLIGNPYTGKSFVLKTLTNAIVAKNKFEPSAIDIGWFVH